VRLGDVLTRIDAGASPKALPRPAADGERGVLKVSAVTWGVFRPDENKALPPGYAGDGVPTVSRGDILISRANTTQLVGALARADQDHPELLLSDKILKLVPASDTASGDYLLRVLRLPHVRELYESRATGTSGSMRNISQATIREALVPLPALAEQRRIARILDQADALRRQRREALALTETFLRSAFLERFGDPVANPKRWPEARLEDAADIASGITKGRKLNGQPTTRVPYMRVANVQDGHIRLDEVKDIHVTADERERFTLRTGDVLLTEGGDPDKLGRGAVWRGEIAPCVHQNHIFRVRCDARRLLPDFASAILGSNRGKRYFARAAKQTTGIASINMTQLRGFPLLLPPLSEQQGFAELVVAFRAHQRRLEQAAAHTDALFESLQQRAFRGDL
jgi:type I restriction enzyme S subunit